MKLKRLAALSLAGVLAVSALCGCGLNKNEVVATCGERNITLGVANFFARYEQASYDDMWAMYGIEDPWSQDLYGNGSTMEETIKSNTMESLHVYYTLMDHMDEYGVSISDEQKAAITEAAKRFMDANSKKALEELGATQEIVEEMLTLYTVYDLMWDAIIADVDTNVSDEEANMRGYDMITISLSDEEADAEALGITADAMLSIINGASDLPESEDNEDAEESDESEESEEETMFEKVAASYGYTATSSTYDADNDTLAEEVKTALDGMKAGDAAIKVTTDDAIYLIQVTTETDEEATETNREDIISGRKDDKFNGVLEEWQANDGWTIKDSVLAKIKFDDLFTTTTESTEESGDVVSTEE